MTGIGFLESLVTKSSKVSVTTCTLTSVDGAFNGGTEKPRGDGVLSFSITGAGTESGGDSDGTDNFFKGEGVTGESDGTCSFGIPGTGGVAETAGTVIVVKGGDGTLGESGPPGPWGAVAIEGTVVDLDGGNKPGGTGVRGFIGHLKIILFKDRSDADFILGRVKFIRFVSDMIHTHLLTNVTQDSRKIVVWNIFILYDNSCIILGGIHNDMPQRCFGGLLHIDAVLNCVKDIIGEELPTIHFIAIVGSFLL
jgi:hypothetical protein